MVLICKNDQHFFLFSFFFSFRKAKIAISLTKKARAHTPIRSLFARVIIFFSYSFFSESNDHHQFGRIKEKKSLFARANNILVSFLIHFFTGNQRSSLVCKKGKKKKKRTLTLTLLQSNKVVEQLSLSRD